MQGHFGDRLGDHHLHHRPRESTDGKYIRRPISAEPGFPGAPQITDPMMSSKSFSAMVAVLNEDGAI